METIGDDGAQRYSDADTAVRPIATEGSPPSAEMECVHIEEGPHRFVAFERRYESAFTCSEVAVSRMDDATDVPGDDESARQRLPPLRIDAKLDANAQNSEEDTTSEWLTLHCQP